MLPSSNSQQSQTSNNAFRKMHCHKRERTKFSFFCVAFALIGGLQLGVVSNRNRIFSDTPSKTKFGALDGPCNPMYVIKE